MKKSLYDLLELSRQASPESIQAAFERISRAAEEKAAAGDGDARTRLIGLKEAHATLGNPERRALYDMRLAAASTPRPEPEMIELADDSEQRRRWMWWAGAAVVLLVIVFGSIRMVTNHRVEQERLRAEKESAIEKQRLDLERQRLEAQQRAEERRINAAEQTMDRVLSRQEEADNERRTRRLEADRIQLERENESDRRRQEQQQRFDEERRRNEERMSRDRERIEAERRLRADKELLRQTCLRQYNRPDC